ncbi:unnamed protein product [Caenorhabditis angaria]|uniref:Cyclic nucleotide-binding domain-containing protein n=1 Tax=Caenorhabditis angaria TaxID=860376 RepID=A0A9P1IQP8_9PELO|nr:unnamed protein product [Caenorhabditis angaria]
MFANFEGSDSDEKFADEDFQKNPRGTRRSERRRRDRSLKYLRAISAKKSRELPPPETLEIPKPVKKPRKNLQILSPTNLPSKWETVRQKTPEILRMDQKNRKLHLDLNKGSEMNAAGTSTNQQGIQGAGVKSFSDVVKTAMLLRNWVTAMEHDERESEPDREATTTNFVEENEERAILGNDHENFTTPPTGIAILKSLILDRLAKGYWFHISQTSSLYYYWTCLIATGILYNMLAMVIFIFDDVFLGYFVPWLTLNCIFDALFLLDIFVQCRMTFNHEGSEVQYTKHLIRNYLRTSRAVPDLISMIPVDVILFINPTVSLVRALKLVKAYRLFDFITLTQKRTDYPHAVKIAFLSTACYILFHWNACVYFLFSLFEGLSEDDTSAFGFSYYKVFDPRFPTCHAFFDNDCWFNEDEAGTLDLDDERPKYMEKMYDYWVNRHYKLEMGNFSREYSMSLYWSALTITTCGQQPWPSTSPQNMLEVVDTLIGVLVFATIIGSVGNVVTQMNQSVYDFREMMDGIKFYMKYRVVNLDIQERVLNCFMYLNTHNQLYDEKEILEVLPPRFQANIAENLHMDTLKRVQLFGTCDARFLREVVLLVKQQVYSPNDYLCRKNEKAKEMFIVKKGTLSVIDDDTGTELELLKEGSTFGELSIVHVRGNLLGDRRSVSLRSVGYSDVYVLHQDDVTRMLQEYPTDREILLKNARHMLHSRGLLETSELGEMCDGEENLEDDAMIDLLSVDEQLARLHNIVGDLDQELTHMITSFAHTTLYYKQRVTALENTFNYNRKRIRRDCIRGLL